MFRVNNKGVFIVNFEHISHLVLVFLLLILKSLLQKNVHFICFVSDKFAVIMIKWKLSYQIKAFFHKIFNITFNPLKYKLNLF